jgi:CHAT domain-containing protein
MPQQRRLLALIAVLLLAGGYYVYATPGVIPFLSGNATTAPSVDGQALIDKSSTLKLDEPTKAVIRKFFAGVTVEPKENDLNYAIQLDQGVGRPQLARGDTRAALATYKKLLAISYLQGSMMGVGIGMQTMGIIIEQTGDKVGSLYATFLAYKVAEAMNNKEEIGVVELTFARKLWHLEKAMALPWLMRARESLKNSRYKADYIRLLPNLADGLRLVRGEREQASALIEEAWSLSQALGNAPDHRTAKWETGMRYAALLEARKDYERAQAVFEQTLGAFTAEERNAPIYISLLQQLAHLQTRLNNPSAARQTLLTAYAHYDLARLNTLGEDGRLWLDEQQKELVDDIVRSFVRADEIAAGLAFLESNKAATLSEIVDNPTFHQAQTKWREMQLRQGVELVKLVDREMTHQRSETEKAPVLIDELARKHGEDAQKLQSELNLKNSTVARSLSAERLQALQRELPPNVAVLAFFVQHRQSSLFVMTRGAIQHIPVLLTGCDCIKAAQQLRVALSNPYTDFYREPAQYLYQKLLGTALKNLPAGVNTIVYSPDGPLARVPLAALMDGEQFVGEKFAVYQVPSLRFLTTPLKQGKKAELSGVVCIDPQVADGRLAAQRDTGAALQKLYGDRVITLADQACSRQTLVSAIEKRKAPLFIHLGAPGFLYPPKKMDAVVLLSADDKANRKGAPWRAAEIAALDLSHVELVTLSTTAPGLLEYKYQRDAIGIVRPLFFAGAKRVLAPLWNTADEPAAEFMKVFYQSYAINIAAPSALQQAQLGLMRSERYRHPHYWASFVLTEGM